LNSLCLLLLYLLLNLLYLLLLSLLFLILHEIHNRNQLLLLFLRHNLLLSLIADTPTKRRHLPVSLSLVLTYLEHHLDCLLVLVCQLQLPLVPYKPSIVRQLPDRLQHRGGELLVVVEPSGYQLR